MATRFYGLRKPVTNIKIDPPLNDSSASHHKVTIWLNGNSLDSGTLLVDSSEIKDLLNLLFDLEADDTTCPIRTSWGGMEVGTIVIENQPGLKDTDILCTGGALIHVGDVRAMEGSGRRVRNADDTYWQPEYRRAIHKGE